MVTDKRQFTLRIKESVFQKIEAIAEKEKRSATMQIEYFIEKAIEEYEKENGPIDLGN
ncbi:MAG: Arc family DNA-binding protein [Acidobacterium ailaaui]|nr:Arc family DNA-binding protein [Pseudacidobacterium ailaaui]